VARQLWSPGSRIALPRIIFFVLLLTVAGTAALWRGAGVSGCIPEQFPDQWLEAQETAGGHTISRHIGKPDQWLISRLDNQPTIHAASSFTDLSDARLGIRAALTQHRAKINNWAANARRPKNQAWHYDGNGFLGRIAERPASLGSIKKTTDLKVVIKTDGKGGCTLLTAYPAPD
jgi:hypothetical protein